MSAWTSATRGSRSRCAKMCAGQASPPDNFPHSSQWGIFLLGASQGRNILSATEMFHQLIEAPRLLPLPSKFKDGVYPVEKRGIFAKFCPYNLGQAN